MASAVKICNMALSHIGASARVSSISPPDGSIEAGHCADFYDLARTELIEPGSWAFALKRAALAQTENDSSTWAFAYTLPSDCLRALRILREGSVFVAFDNGIARATDDRGSADFAIEGRQLYTHEETATLVYVQDVTDASQFPPSFTSALSYLLASYLAGPIVKGNEGAKLGDGMRTKAMQLASVAATASANASSEAHDFLPSGVIARR